MKTDLEIQNDVMEELLWEPSLKAAEIGVSVKNGAVTLSGTVDSYFKKVAAEKAAKRINGVKAVAEDIEVKLPSSARKNDTEIAQAIVNSLKWYSYINEDKVKVKVEDNWVTVEGEVDWEFQKNAVTTVVENLTGVKGITNLIKIKPMTDPKDIRKKISSAFHRAATIDAEKITIETIGSKVILKGKVHSYTEKNDAEHAAWSAPGVETVDNKLEVDYGMLVY